MKLDKLFSKPQEEKEKPVGQTKRRVAKAGVILAGLALAANTAEAQKPALENDKDAINQEKATKTEMTVEQQSPQVEPNTITWGEAVDQMNEREVQDIEGDPTMPQSVEESYKQISEVIKSNPDNVSGYLVLSDDGEVLTSIIKTPFKNVNAIETAKAEQPHLADAKFVEKYESIIVDNYDDFVEKNTEKFQGKEMLHERFSYDKLIESKQDFTIVEILPSPDGGEVKVIIEVHEKGVTITAGLDNELSYLISYQVPEGLDTDNGVWIPGNFPDDYKKETRRLIIQNAIYSSREIDRSLYKGQSLAEAVDNLKMRNGFEVTNLGGLDLGLERQEKIEEAAQDYMSGMAEAIEDFNQQRLESEAAAREKAADQKTSSIKGAFSK